MTPAGLNRIQCILLAVATVALAGLFAVITSADSASADHLDPHMRDAATPDTCAACHRAHTGQNETLLRPVAQSTLCFTCHDGTGSVYNVAAEYSDANVSANDPSTSSFYSHLSPDPSVHTSAKADEFGGTFNRHAECSDCHNAHTLTALNSLPSPYGWIASGAESATSGVTSALTWVNSLAYEYELCLKCHSSYTQLLGYTAPSQLKSDKAAEFNPGNASYHPVFAPGKNTTTPMENSLAGGSLWQFTTASTIRCVNCHANGSFTAGAPFVDGNLAPHASQNRSLLLANYRDRELKPAGEAFNSGDFQLCFLCHSAAPFADGSQTPRDDTNFQLHGLHLSGLLPEGNGSLDIDSLGAGQGNAICAECHFELHSTSSAPYADNQNYSRGVNFAPNVVPASGEISPRWSGPTDRTCTLVCHGESHAGQGY